MNKFVASAGIVVAAVFTAAAWSYAARISLAMVSMGLPYQWPVRRYV